MHCFRLYGLFSSVITCFLVPPSEFSYSLANVCLNLVYVISVNNVSAIVSGYKVKCSLCMLVAVGCPSLSLVKHEVSSC